MKKRSAYTLVELAVTTLIITIVSSMAISPLIQDIPEHKVKSDLVTIERAIKIAKSEAAKTSGTTIIDFSQATSNVGDNGGLIQIKDLDGSTLESLSLTKNVCYNAAGSTIASHIVRFNFMGQPVDSSGATSGFTTSNNTIAISYYNNNTAAATSRLTISPLTGNSEF